MSRAKDGGCVRGETGQGGDTGSTSVRLPDAGYRHGIYAWVSPHSISLYRQKGQEL